MIPMCLVSGFLGSGKTTLLKVIARREQKRRLLFLVNEFAPADVDGATLLRHGADVVAIAGGSIFCRCLVGKFVEQLTAIADAGGIDGLVVEASGVADPRVTRQMLAETKLDQRLDLRRVISVVDPATFPKLLKTLASVPRQIEAADTVVVSKMDLHDTAALAAVEKEVRSINPEATILRSRQGEAALDPLSAAPPRQVSGAYAACADPAYATVALAPDQPVDAEALLAMLQSPGVYRAKGAIQTEAGWRWVEATAARVTLAPVEPQSSPRRPCGELALIVAGEQEAAFQSAVDRLTGQPARSGLSLI